MLKYIFLIIIISFIIKVIIDFDILAKVPTIEEYNRCNYLNVDILGPEDLTYYKKGTILISQGNLGRLSNSPPIQIEQQGIYAIKNAHQSDFEIIRCEMSGFPKNVAFNPHGIYIAKDNDMLYVINHAYTQGGERIEIFKINSNYTLTYRHSLIMDNRYVGRQNDLIALSENRLLITELLPYPQPIEGKHKIDFSWKLKTNLHYILRLKGTYVIDCSFNLNSIEIIPNCTEIQETQNLMNNGIAWDNKNTIWVGDTLSKGITEYELTNSGQLIFKQFINTVYGVDNIEYNEEQNKLIIGLVPKLFNFMQLEAFLKNNSQFQRNTTLDYQSAVGIYDIPSQQFRIVASGNQLSKGLSAAVLVADKLFLGSWCDVSVMICKQDLN